MADTDWIIKAIEKEAMARAIAEVDRYSTFSFIGFDPNQLAIIVNHACTEGCHPKHTLNEITNRLKRKQSA